MSFAQPERLQTSAPALPTAEQLPAVWRSAPRRWGHPLHSMCSYMAMFPPTIPHTFINWLTNEGDIVYDPFCGRGTTPLEARLLGRVGYGSDANPLAVVLASAKATPPARQALTNRIASLKRKIRVLRSSDEPEHVRMLFSEKTLGQLLWLRRELDLNNATDCFIMGTLLGVIHRNADRAGNPTGLTIAMPNTFSMAPGYIRKYIDEHGLEPPEADVLKLIERRIPNFFPAGSCEPAGEVWRQKAQLPATGPMKHRRAKLVFTSPPYLQATLYGKFNWIRLWMLGQEPKPVDRSLFTSTSLPKYTTFMSEVVSALAKRIKPNGYICLVIGDVEKSGRRLNLAAEVAKSIESDFVSHFVTIDDNLPVEHKVSRIWKDRKGRATKTDRVLILGGPEAELPEHLPSISWD